MKKLRSFYLFGATLLIGFAAKAQLPDCTLSIGGKDTEVLTRVFQLNDEQIKTMELWIGELQTQSKLAEDQIKELFDNHPQSTHEELETLSKKYKVIKDQMVANSKRYDKKLLALFNPKQYQRYVELCDEAIRSPLSPAVEVKVDSVTVKPE